MKQEELVGDEDDIYFNWEEAEWEENKLFYEYDLEHLEELSKREGHTVKEKM